MPANFSGALLKRLSGRGNKARTIGRTPITPNQLSPLSVSSVSSVSSVRCLSLLTWRKEARTPELQIDNEHEHDDVHDCARQKKPTQLSPFPCPPCDAFLS